MRDPATWLAEPVLCVTCHTAKPRMDFLFQSRPFTHQTSCHECRRSLFKSVSIVEPPTIVCSKCNKGRPAPAFLDRTPEGPAIPIDTWVSYGPARLVSVCYPCRSEERKKARKANAKISPVT